MKKCAKMRKKSRAKIIPKNHSQKSFTKIIQKNIQKTFKKTFKKIIQKIHSQINITNKYHSQKTDFFILT